MDAQLVVERIVEAKRWSDLFTKGNYRSEYKDFIKIIHPDVCRLPKANEAVTLLNRFKGEVDLINQAGDDAGSLKVEDEYNIYIYGESHMLNKSFQTYRNLKTQNDGAADHFKRMLPEMVGTSDSSLYFKLKDRTFPLTGYSFSQEQVAWILSRMFEFVGWIHQLGYVHCGINPESVWIVPETHGLIFSTFYHTSEINSRLDTLSGRYLSWYPAVVFDQKQAIPYIDLSLIQRTGLYLLGDTSGNGIKLKKSCDERFVDFLITPHFDSFKTYKEYRELLANIFGKPKFHHLKI